MTSVVHSLFTTDEWSLIVELELHVETLDDVNALQNDARKAGFKTIFWYLATLKAIALDLKTYGQLRMATIEKMDERAGSEHSNQQIANDDNNQQS